MLFLKISHSVKNKKHSVNVKHILDLDFENALDEGKKVQYDGVELDIFNEDGTILKEWIQDVA
jgi:hypothetical protein